jgi:ABC-type amino acid transport system permease subunit
MTSGTWLRDHESLAALVFIVLSLALTGVFAWLERRYFRK